MTKKYLVRIYPQPVEYTIEAENEAEATDRAVRNWTPDYSDVCKTEVEEIEE